MSTFEQEVGEGRRFEFGKNWTSFLNTLNEERIAVAEKSLKEMLDVGALGGRRFLDIGSGSGIFSLVARRLGAVVFSFDYDPMSVACAQELRRRYFPEDEEWAIARGSVLDGEFLKTLPAPFDIVYSWGVLHHTGSMWEAIGNAAGLVREGGVLFIALYNDEGWRSRAWRMVKRAYCSSVFGRLLVSGTFLPYFFAKMVISSILRCRNIFASYKRERGMSVVHDWLDWLGGYPFEVASVEAVFSFLKAKGFRLANIKTTNGLGNNELVFVRGEMNDPRDRL